MTDWEMSSAARAIFLGACLVGLVALVVSASRRTLPGRIYVPVDVGSVAYRPSTLYMSPDGADEWLVVDWRRYGGWTAEALVKTAVNDCEPACAGGRWSFGQMTVRLQRVVRCHGVFAYGTLVVLGGPRSDPGAAFLGSKLDLQRYCDGSFALSG